MHAWSPSRTTTVAFATLEDQLRADTAHPLVSFEAWLPAVGDASTTYVMTSGPTGNPIVDSATRIDDLVVTVRVSQTTAPLKTTTQALLLAQVACMQANDCAQPIPVPPEIVPALPVS